MVFFAGQHRIYSAVGYEAPLKFTTTFDATEKEWFVTTKFLRDGEPAIELGCEPLADFPSEMLIAQCMLVCQ